MSGDTDERLQRLLGGDALTDLRWHFERTDPAAWSGTIRLYNVSAREYEALAQLIGRRPRLASSIQIDVAAIDADLSRAGIAPSLTAALARLDGPIAHLPTVRAETAARWAAVADGARHPGLAPVLHAPAGFVLLKRLARRDGCRRGTGGRAGSGLLGRRARPGHGAARAGHP